MSASVAFSDVETMLKHCADGYTLRIATHYRIVKYNGKVFRSLPKHDTIELGHLRKMVRYLEISRDCANNFLPLWSH